MAHLSTKFASNKQDWTTPQSLFDKLNQEFNFDFDLAASQENTKCEQFFSIEQDAMKQDWQGVCFLNPPYGSKDHKLQNWVIKAQEESQKNDCTVVMLIPARTNTVWFEKYIFNCFECKFVIGRPKFGNATHGLPQPLVIAVFKKSNLPTKFSCFKA